MYASKGGLTHRDIMSLTWRQFGTYLDAFGWLMNEQTEDGKRENRTNDLHAQMKDPRVKALKDKLVRETKAELEAFERKKV
jgi:hypothetical protein